MFKEMLVLFDFENGNLDFWVFLLSMKVLVLKYSDLIVWDSFVILEYVVELVLDV